MAQIVIDIPDEQAKFYCTFQFRVLCDNSGIVGLIDNEYFEERYGIKSTVLPKGHGNLVDADKVVLGLVYGKHIDKAKCGEITKIFDNAVVIPADKGDIE